MRHGLRVAALCWLGVCGGALAHDGETHGTAAEAAAHRAATAAASSAAPVSAGVPFPLDLGGAFTLTDHTGAARTEADPEGRLQLLFFGYANCEAICSVALPLMGEVVRDLSADGIAVTPVMVTVDPERDRVDTMAAPLAAHHPGFVGLTGGEAALEAVYDLFAVERTVVFTDPDLGEVFAHGSHIFLLDGQGKMLTLIPPILSAERVAEIVAGYAAGL